MRGLAEPFHQTGGDDPHHARMPVLPFQHQNTRRQPFRLLFQAFQHLAEYRRLRRLPLDVELLDVLRQRRGLLPIGGQQQPGRRFGAAHPARRINPGGQGEHRCGSGHPLVSHPRDLHQLGQSRPPALVHHLQPSAHQRAVFPPQLHHVRQSAQRHQIAVFLHHLVGITVQRANQLEGHTHPGVVLAGAAAVRPVRIHHRHRLRQGFLRLVMVGDDHVHPQFRRVGGLLQRGDAVVHRYQQFGAHLLELFHRIPVQTVALALSLRDVVHHVRFPLGQEVVQQRRGGHAVGVVIAEHRDPLVAVDGPLNAFHRRVHIGKGEHVVPDLPIDQEIGGLFQVGDAPRGQQQGQKGMNLTFFRQICRQIAVRLRYGPSFHAHNPSRPVPLHGFTPYT